MKYLFIFLLFAGCATTQSVDNLKNEIDGLRYDVRQIKHTVDSLKRDAGPTWEIR